MTSRVQRSGEKKTRKTKKYNYYPGRFSFISHRYSVIVIARRYCNAAGVRENYYPSSHNVRLHARLRHLRRFIPTIVAARDQFEWKKIVQFFISIFFPPVRSSPSVTKLYFSLCVRNNSFPVPCVSRQPVNPRASVSFLFRLFVFLFFLRPPGDSRVRPPTAPTRVYRGVDKIIQSRIVPCWPHCVVFDNTA